MRREDKKRTRSTNKKCFNMSEKFAEEDEEDEEDKKYEQEMLQYE